MKRKYGFTLIELLAVIVVLAIIALIAVPIVLNLIEKAKDGAFKDSAYAISKAAENYYISNYNEKETILNTVLPISKLKYNGNINQGNIVYNDKGNYALLIMHENNCAYKYAASYEIFFGNVESNACIVNGVPITINDLITVTIVDKEETKVSNIKISDNGEITYTEDGKTYIYNISSDGNMTKNGSPVSMSDRDNEFSIITKTILSDIDATTALLNNQTLIDGFKTNNAAMEIILDGFVEYFKIQYNLPYINSDIEDIKNRITNINGGAATIQEGTDIQTRINSYITSLNNVIDKADIIITNFGKILEKNEFVDEIFELENVKTKLLSNSSAVIALANNEYSSEKLLNDVNNLNFVINNQSIVDELLKDESFIDAITKNSEAFNNVANNSQFMAKALESQLFREKIYENASVTEPILSGSTVAINAMRASSKFITLTKTLPIRVDNMNVASLNTLIYEEKAFIIDFTITSDNNPSVIMGKYIVGDPVIAYVNNSKNTVKKFASSVKGAKRSSSAAHSVKVNIFKIND